MERDDGDGELGDSLVLFGDLARGQNTPTALTCGTVER